jgi:ABC-type antimicrobial peptide transport system permease subunit
MVRPAVGAAPRRLVRQLLTESSLLSAAGGFLGAALGCGNVGLLRNSFPQIHNWPIPCARTLL